MRKIFLMAILIACAAPFTFAQTSDDYNKVDVFVGFSHNRVDTGISDEDEDIDDILDEREGFNGFNASVAALSARGSRAIRVPPKVVNTPLSRR